MKKAALFSGLYHLCGSQNREVRLGNNAATKKLLEKMFAAALQESFSRFARKYGQDAFIHTWGQIGTMDYLDDCCDSVEAVIPERNKRERG